MKSERRVALVLGNLSLGGAERQALELARRLPNYGWKPVIALAEERGELVGDARRAGIPVHCFGARWDLPVRSPRFWSGAVRTIARLRDILVRERCSVVHSFLFWEGVAAVPAGVLARNVQGIVTSRRTIAHFKDRRPHYQWIENALNPFVDAVACNSGATRRDALRRERLRPERIVIIRNGVDAERISRTTALDVRGAFPALADADAVAVMAAHFKAVKRHDLALEALARARRGRPGLKALFLGRDLGTLARSHALADRLGLGDAVVFAGAYDDPTPIVAGSDIALLASDYEGMPNAVLEAMAAGRPVAATASASVREVVRNGREGLLARVGDAEGLARSLERLAGDGDLRRRLGEAGRRRARDLFSLDRMVRETAALYERLAFGSRAG